MSFTIQCITIIIKWIKHYEPIVYSPDSLIGFFFLFVQVDRAAVCLGDGSTKSDCPSRVRYNALPVQWTLGFIDHWLCGNSFSNKHWTIYLPHFGKCVPLRRRRVVPDKNGSRASRGHYCVLFLFLGLSPKSVVVVGRNDDGDKFDNNRNFQNTERNG